MGYLRRSRCRRIFARGRRRDVPLLVISALDRVATLSRILSGSDPRARVVHIARAHFSCACTSSVLVPLSRSPSRTGRRCRAEDAEGAETRPPRLLVAGRLHVGGVGAHFRSPMPPPKPEETIAPSIVDALRKLVERWTGDHERSSDIALLRDIWTQPQARDPRARAVAI